MGENWSTQRKPRTLTPWDSNTTQCTISYHHATLLLVICEHLNHNIFLCNLHCTHPSSPDRYPEIVLAVCLSVLSPCCFFMTCEKTYACIFSHFLPPCREPIPKCMSKKIPLHITASIALHYEHYLALIVFGTYRLSWRCSIRFLWKSRREKTHVQTNTGEKYVPAVVQLF